MLQAAVCPRCGAQVEYPLTRPSLSSLFGLASQAPDGGAIPESVFVRGGVCHELGIEGVSLGDLI